MYYIDPITTLDSHLLTGTTLAEDTTAVWASGTFAVGDERHVVETHSVYRCAVAGTSSTRPDLDTAGQWVRMRPTNKWAPFDYYASTAATTTAANITYVLSARFINAVRLDAVVGKSVTVTVRNGLGGTVLWTKTRSLQRGASGWWDYAYGQRRQIRALWFTGLPISSSAVIEITIAADGTNTRAVGSIVRGKLKRLQGRGDGGVQQGAEASPKTYTYRRVNDDGTVQIVPRSSSKDLTLDVVVQREFASTAVSELEQMMGRPVAVMASLNSVYDGLSVFGFITKGPVRYSGTMATIQVTVEGTI